MEVERSASSWSNWMGMGLPPAHPPSGSPRESPRAQSTRAILKYAPDGQPLNPEDENSMKNHLFYAVERADLEHVYCVLAVHEVNTLSLLFAVSEGPQQLTAYDRALFEDGLLGHEQLGAFWADNRRGRSEGLFTPLHIAARQGYADVASCLLHNLELYVGKGSGEVVTSYTNKVTCAEEGLTPLHLAVYAPLAAEDRADYGGGGGGDGAAGGQQPRLCSPRGIGAAPGLGVCIRPGGGGGGWVVGRCVARPGTAAHHCPAPTLQPGPGSGACLLPTPPNTGRCCCRRRRRRLPRQGAADPAPGRGGGGGRQAGLPDGHGQSRRRRQPAGGCGWALRRRAPSGCAAAPPGGT
jgi:hypothetical protein